MYGNDYRYAATRLDDTIARLKDGTPVYIHHVEANGNTFYYLLADMGKVVGKEPKVDRLENFNLEPVSLGYVNDKQGCTYLSRMPIRRYKQGLRLNENCIADNKAIAKVDYAALALAIQGKYPSFAQVTKVKDDKNNNPFKQVRDNILMAWNRFWAYDSKNKDVHYRGDVVGKVVDGAVKLLPQYKYLQESLMESV